LVTILRFIPNAKNPNPATEILKFSLAAFVECRLNRGAMTRAELSATHELIEGLLDELLQIDGNQVEKDLAVVKSPLQALPRSKHTRSSISQPMGSVKYPLRVETARKV